MCIGERERLFISFPEFLFVVREPAAQTQTWSGKPYNTSIVLGLVVIRTTAELSVTIP